MENGVLHFSGNTLCVQRLTRRTISASVELLFPFFPHGPTSVKLCDRSVDRFRCPVTITVKASADPSFTRHAANPQVIIGCYWFLSGQRLPFQLQSVSVLGRCKCN